MRSTVSIIKCEDYKPSNVIRAVREAVDLLGGMESFVRPGQRVLLKPNLLAPHPPEAVVCTHPAVVEAVIGLASAAAGSICTLGDSPCISAETPEGFEKLLATTGMGDVLQRTGASTARFDDAGTEREYPDAKVFRRLLLSDALESADVIINIPKFKTHELTQLTGAVKNLFGCVPGRRKLDFHMQAGDDPVMFAQVLVDILRAVRPALSIMDGIVGMDGQGPAAGRRRSFGLVIASADPVALDAVACMAAGVDPMIIPALRLADEQGVGVADRERIDILGTPLAEVHIPDFLLPPRGDQVSRMPKPVYRLLRNQLVRSPVFLRAKCTGCRTCLEACPVRAITGDCGQPGGDRKDLRIDYSACIRCYCCQEVCPEEAIRLRTKPLRRIMDRVMTTALWMKREL